MRDAKQEVAMKAEERSHAENERLWVAEAERRSKEMRQGAVAEIPSEEVVRRARAAISAAKYSKGLAGEFLVAGELLRRGITAAVTYGNAKKADVVAVSGATAASIEVKTSSEAKWIVGSHVPRPSEDLWIFVFLPSEDSASPEYFVLTARELHELLSPEDVRYRARYLEKHGTDFKGPGVVSLRRAAVAGHRGAWDKVKARLSVSVDGRRVSRDPLANAQ